MGIAVWILYKGVYLMLGFIGSSYVVNAAAALVSVFGGMIIYFFVMIQVRGITNMI